MDFEEAKNRACEELTIEDALTFIVLWETERVVRRVRKDSGMWESCYGHCIKRVMEEYVWQKIKSP